MDLGEILRKAWQIAWRNKGLWILGILAGCSGGGGNPSQSISYQGSGEEFPFLQRTFSNIPPDTLSLIIAALVVAGLVAAVVFLVLGTLGRAGLIAGVSHADQNETVSLGQAWRLGVPHFWRLIGVTLVAAGVVVAVAIVFAVIATLGAVATFGIGLLCLIPLICLAVPLALLAGAYFKLVQNAVVVENLGVMDSFRRAWRLGRDHLGPVVLVGLVLILLGAVAGLVVAAPFLALALPALVFLSSGGEPGRLMLVGLVCGAVYLPVMIVASGLITTFIDGSWTLTYRRMAGLTAPAPGPA